jgi:hypothetical protein
MARQSLALDTAILFRTLLAVVGRPGEEGT